MGYDIFLSYSRPDRQLAEQFVQTAAARGVNVWFDEKIEGGQDWRERIVDALGSAKALVILFSQHSNASTQLIKELAVADDLRKRVIPVLVSDCEPRGAYLYELASRNWINIYPSPETRLAPLIDDLTKQLAMGGAAPIATAANSTTPTPAARETSSLPDAMPGTAATFPTQADNERHALLRSKGSWFPLGRYDLYVLGPILLGSFAAELFGAGDNKNAGLGFSLMASFVYIFVIAVRNARLNRSIFSAESFASYVVVYVIAMSPMLVSEGTVSDKIGSFFGLIIIALFMAVFASVLQVVLRTTFQRSIFRSSIARPLGT